MKPGSVGSALPGVSIRLVDETGGTPYGSDPGEIQVAGDNLFDGYWPEASDGPVDGWFATGDVGFLDPDGDLFLVDRLKEIIIVSGFNVYPSEVEDVLSEIEGVLESAVVGVPDDLTGEAVVAYVRPDPDRISTSPTRSSVAGLRRRIEEACEARAGAVQAAVPDRGGRGVAPDRHRQDREGAAPHGAAPRGNGTDRVTDRGATCRRRPADRG